MRLKRLFLAAMPFVAAWCGLTSCGDKQDLNNLDYLAVKLESGGDWSIIDGNGDIVVKEEYAADCQISPVIDGAYWVRDSEGYHLYNIDNPKKPAMDKVYASATAFSNGRAAVSNPDEPIAIIDTDGETVRQLGEDVTRVYKYQDDYAAYYDSNKNKCGYIDKDGTVVIPARYAIVFPFSEGLALAVKEFSSDSITIIDKKGNETGSIDAKKYSLVTSIFNEGMVAAYGNDDMRLVMLDSKGEKTISVAGSVCPMDKKSINAVNIDGTIVYADASGKYGLADYEGERLIRPKYDKLFCMGEGLYAAEKNGKLDLIDKEDNSLDNDNYESILFVRLGGNIIAKQEDTYDLYDPDDKFHRRGRSFIEYSLYQCDEYCEYVSVATVANLVLGMVETDNAAGVYPDFTPAECAKLLNVSSPSDYTRTNVFESKHEFHSMPELGVETTLRFSGVIAEAVTRNEKVSDGWWSYNRTVIDGYKYSDAHPVVMGIRITLPSKTIPADFLFSSICKGVQTKGFVKVKTEKNKVIYMAQVKGCSSAFPADNKASLTVSRTGTGISMEYKYPSAAGQGFYVRPEGVTPSSDDKPSSGDAGKADVPSDDYSWLSERLATAADIKGKTSAGIRLMRNAIFARHGYIFKDKSLTEYFSKFSWYKAERNDVTGLLNDIETKNIAFLKSHE